MRNDSTRTNAVDAYPVAVQRRLIELLLTVAPDAPVPLTLLENIIAIDSITEGPTPSIADNVALVPSVLGAAVGVVESVRDIQRNMNRDTLTITASAQEQLRQQYAALGLGKRRRRQARDDIPASVCLVVEMYNAASFLPEADTQDYTHDQLALLVPHLLHLIQTECADISGSWGPVQSMTTLWLLNDHGVVAQNDVAAYTHRVMAYCEPRYSAWNELLTVGDVRPGSRGNDRGWLGRSIDRRRPRVSDGGRHSEPRRRRRRASTPR